MGVNADITSAFALEQSQGRDIVIEAPITQLTDGTMISSAGFGTSDAGAILIEAKQSSELTGRGQITSSIQTASGGNITLEPGGLLHLRGSSISIC